MFAYTVESLFRQMWQNTPPQTNKTAMHRHAHAIIVQRIWDLFKVHIYMHRDWFFEIQVHIQHVIKNDMVELSWLSI